MDGTGDASPRDFAWRFRLDEKAAPPSPLAPPMELLRVQWEQLLALTVPFHGDVSVRVDGFSSMRETATVLPVWLDDPRWSMP